MRRRKKDKTKEKVPSSSTEHDTPDSSGRGGGSGSKSSKDADASNNGVTVTVSPPQQRKRSLLGSLGSMRDLVEQVRADAGMVDYCVYRSCAIAYLSRYSHTGTEYVVAFRGTFRIGGPNRGSDANMGSDIPLNVGWVSNHLQLSVLVLEWTRQHNV